jgi:NAD(P)H dehydrogenase (quinone)
VVQELRRWIPDHEIVAITRAPEAVTGPVEGRLGDYDRPETLASAYAGLDRLLLIPGADLRPGVHATQITAAVDAAVEANVGHIFLLSATGTRVRAEPAIGAGYWAGEHRLLRSDAKAWTILRMNFFAETFAEQGAMAAGIGHIPGFAENKAGFVSREDVALACAGALASDNHAGAIYNLSGPDRVSGAERAAFLSKATGKPIAFQVLTEEQLRSAMGQAGLPPFIVDAIVSMQEAQAEGAYDVVGGDLEKLAGRPPRSLQSVLSEKASS